MKKWTTHSAFLFLHAALLIGILCLSLPAAAQGCASCYTTAAAGGSRTIHALRSGILVLLVPPLLVLSGILIATTRWKQPGSLMGNKSRS
jgi:di/tricarboxylate transporter